ncbi:MAG TPA: carbohydrate porin [Acidobacteriaceae bacterium]|nr:carbohydrate porin [Acidobacteriaceae bacterium]
MLTCNLFLAICLLQAGQPTSVPCDQAQLHTTSVRVRAYFLASYQPSAAQASEIAAKAWLPNPQQAPFTTTSPALPLNTPPPGQTQLTFFPHSDTARYWISGQANSIFQMHGNFHSPYQGPNSFTAPFQYKASEVGTLYLGYQLNKNPRYETDVLYDEENAGGRGLSQAFGLAGFTNLDVVRNPNLGPTPYLARVELHQTIGFSNEMVPQERGPFALATQVPVRRLDLRIGAFGLPDTFDGNAVLSDSHLQFMNWTVDNNGAWDYAADTRGYTRGVVIEYQDRIWALRYALALMPTVANGITLDWALRRARAQNMELEIRKGFLPGRDGAIRVLAYGNNAHMGDYREAVNHYLEGLTPTPEITSVEKYDTLKYGFGINVEQDVTPNFRLAGRFGWNEGQHESFAYTEDDQTFLFGADYAMSRWHRKFDKLGIAFVTNAIKKDHQNYLRLGGLGFLLGDGNLNYAREDILEGYYNIHAWRGLYYAVDYQNIQHPGYNQDRGPINVESFRLHIDF